MSVCSAQLVIIFYLCIYMLCRICRQPSRVCLRVLQKCAYSLHRYVCILCMIRRSPLLACLYSLQHRQKPLPVRLYALQNVSSEYTCVSERSAGRAFNLCLCSYVLQGKPSASTCVSACSADVFCIYLCVCMPFRMIRKPLPQCLSKLRGVFPHLPVCLYRVSATSLPMQQRSTSTHIVRRMNLPVTLPAMDGSYPLYP